jgi:hypothetical protein
MTLGKPAAISGVELGAAVNTSFRVWSTHFKRGRISVMPDEQELIEQSKQFLSQLTPDVRPIFGAVLIASAIRDAGNKIAHAINAKDKKWEVRRRGVKTKHAY